MKLQNLTVIFIIIIIPIILIVSLYISTGLRTIQYQSLYDTGLLTATHDAIYAFEINTANNVYSDNADTKRNILKSSIKMFEKSLCNTCGISSYNTNEIEEYIPAIVFGMYDGFYMYAPSGVYNNDTSKIEYKHNLKNYVYYSETLSDGTNIIYSLDNYVVVSGKFGSKYEIKEGYLVNLDDIEINEEKVKYKGMEIDEKHVDAIKYYKESFEFTKWFLDTANMDSKADYLKISSLNDPEDEDSPFVQNKRKIMKEKIESVLNSSIVAYSERTWNQKYKMPKLAEEDWQKIYSNISMITFFQGKSIGLTKYNGYCVLNSTNSNEYVNPNLMYFTDQNGEYHDIRCSKKAEGELDGYKIGSFRIKKISGQGETTTEYIYEHDELACYNCVNGSLDTKVSVQKYVEQADPNIQLSYYTSLARERYKQVKLLDSNSDYLKNINIKVAWEDSNNIPDEVNYKLLKNGEEFINDIKIVKSENWEKNINDLEIYESGTEIVYDLEESFKYAVDGYEGSIEKVDNTWKITYTPITRIAKTVKVEFDDNNNQDGIRPENVTVKLSKNVNGIISEVGQVKLSNNVNHTWSNLLTREKGKEVYYFIESELISGYTTSSIEENNEIVLTYTHTPEVITKEIKVEWDDLDNMYNTRPNSVQVVLYKNGTMIENITLSKNTSDSTNDFKCTRNLPKYENGAEIEYTVEGKTISRYTMSLTEENNEIVLTYTHIPEVITKEIKVEWDDLDNMYNTRPNSVQVELYKNGTKIENITLSKNASNSANDFKCTRELLKYENGNEIEYTIKEKTPSGYIVKYSDDTFTITNGITVKIAQETKYVKTDGSTKLYDEYGNKVVLPAGFMITADASRITQGIVIEDAMGNATDGSQFVWIPVGRVYTNVSRTSYKTITLGRYEFDLSGKASAYSGDYTEDTSSTHNSNYANEIAKDINGFKKSVNNYGGYYIGRYEARDGKTSTPRTSSTSDNNTLVSIANKYVYNHVRQQQASALSKSMYQNSTTVTSDLINSYAWDTAIVFIQEMGNTAYSRQTSKNSYLATKGSGKDVVCNIWDMASNCFEWTTETYNSVINNPVVKRGGSSTVSSDNYYTSYRRWDPVTSSGGYYSFRPILYIN